MSEIRPSNILRRERCPGSFRAEAEVSKESEERELRPSEKSTDAAVSGSNLHADVAEGIKFPAKRIEIIANSEDPDILESCWKEAQKCWDDLTPDQRQRAIILVEKQISLESLGMGKHTPDFAIVVKGTEIESGRIILRDWKTGFGWVPSARWNPQTLCYAVGIAHGFSIDGPADIGIFQPRLRDFADTWIASPSDLALFPNRVSKIIERCMDENAPCIPGGHCGCCRASSSCKSRLMVAAEVKTLASPVAALKAVEGSARTKLYTDLILAAGMLKDALAEVNAGILDGSLVVDGFEKGEGKKSREWIDSAEDPIRAKLSNLAFEKGLNTEDVLKPISVADAEKLFGKKAIDGHFIVQAGNPTVKRKKEK